MHMEEVSTWFNTRSQHSSDSKVPRSQSKYVTDREQFLSFALFLSLSLSLPRSLLFHLWLSRQMRTPCKTDRAGKSSNTAYVNTNTQVSSSSSATQPPHTTQASSVSNLLHLRKSKTQKFTFLQICAVPAARYT